MCREVPSPGPETISVSEYVPFVSAAGTRIKQRSPGLVSSHFTIRSLLLGVTSTSIALDQRHILKPLDRAHLHRPPCSCCSAPQIRYEQIIMHRLQLSFSR